MNTETELDIRSVAPAKRHPMIFKWFDRLRNGESFVLVNDHDPKPLYYQFQAERTGTFAGNIWRVARKHGVFGLVVLKLRHHCLRSEAPKFSWNYCEQNSALGRHRFGLRYC